MSDTTQLVKEKLDLADFLRQYVKLTPAGKNLKGLCPFHKEKTPSFMVSPERQMWHCFGSCGEGGDIFKFVMKYENLEFFDALKMLAEKAGIDLRQYGNPDQKRHNILYEINNAAKDFFKKSFTPEAAAYLKERGLKKETIEEFEIGFAANTRDGLTGYLLKKGFQVQEIERAGLAFKTERGTYWDRFRNRIMFPLYNQFGKVLAFTGRIMPGETADVGKYVNSPETPIFSKSKLMFGLHKSKNFIRENKSAVLCEGQMDLIMMWQDGIKNAVAVSGTALTNDHLKLLKRLADNLVLVFDSDEAGQQATERAIDLANAEDFTAKIVVMPLGHSPTGEAQKDPADVVREQSGMMAKYLGAALPVMEYYLQKYLAVSGKRSGLEISDVKKNIRVVLSKIKNIYSPVERAHWLKELEKRTGVAERHLEEEMGKLETADDKLEISKGNFDPVVPKRTRKEIISDRLLTLVTVKPELGPRLDVHKEYLPVVALEDGGLASLRASLAAPEEPEKISQEFEGLLRQLKLEHYKEKRQEFLQLIRTAETTKDEAGLNRVLREFDNLNKEMQNL